MLNGGSGDDAEARANYEFHRHFGLPALLSVGLDPARYADNVPHAPGLEPTSVDDLSPGGAMLYAAIKTAIDAGGMDRVVLSAGGGHNAGAEAIALLRYHWYRDEQILDHFAMVQHSTFNWYEATEPEARDIAAPFSIRIQDQNPWSGVDLAPAAVSPACTSSEFAGAWAIARVGTALSGIPHHLGTTDMSDAGSHAFAAAPELLDSSWLTRNNGLHLGNPPAAIRYAGYGPTQAHADMNACRRLVVNAATAWLGGKYGNPAGLRLDLAADVLVDGRVAASGQLDDVALGGPAINQTVLGAIPFGAGPVRLAPTSTVAVRLSVRRTCSGGGPSSGAVRLWYNGPDADTGFRRGANSRLEASVDGASARYYLTRSGLAGKPGTRRQFTEVTVNSGTPCPDRPFTPIGTWSLTGP
jgi:hypothetical protein